MSKAPQPPFSQQTCRIIGAVCLVVAAGLAWFGGDFLRMKPGLGLLALYWGGFLFAMAGALYMVWLDLRFLRHVYVSEERDIFKATLGSEEFQRAIREAQAAEAAERARQQRDQPPS
jgi:hypothetical protein